MEFKAQKYLVVKGTERGIGRNRMEFKVQRVEGRSFTGDKYR